jgi:hypothetical protein
MKIIESTTVDPPSKRYRSGAEVQGNPFTDEEMRGKRYKNCLSLKAEFERHAGG